MRRLMVVLLVATALMAVGGKPAVAIDAQDVIAELQLRGYYADPGVDIDIDEMERIVGEATDVYFVALADDPVGGNDLFATDVLARLVEGTVVVVSPGEIGARSNLFDDEAINAAVDASIDLFDTSYASGFEAFSHELDDSSRGSGLVFLLFIGVIVGLVWWAIRRSNRNRQEMFEDRIDEIKAEIQGQLSEAANDILELEDDVLLSDNEQAKDLYYVGSAGYARFQDSLAKAQSLAELDELAEGIDLTLWQLESAASLLDGSDPPPKPQARPDFQPPPVERRRPELPEDLQMRRRRREQRGAGSRQRSSAGLGGLGAAAVTLRTLTHRRSPRIRSPRSVAGRVWKVPRPASGGSHRPPPKRGQRPTPSRRSVSPKPKGRARRKRG